MASHHKIMKCDGIDCMSTTSSHTDSPVSASISIKTSYDNGKILLEYELRLDGGTNETAQTLCKSFSALTPTAEISKVMIKIKTTDSQYSASWAAQSVMIPDRLNDNEREYRMYSLAPPQSHFWVSTNYECEDLENNVHSYPCCPNGQWCRLYSAGKLSALIYHFKISVIPFPNNWLYVNQYLFMFRRSPLC